MIIQRYEYICTAVVLKLPESVWMTVRPCREGRGWHWCICNCTTIGKLGANFRRTKPTWVLQRALGKSTCSLKLLKNICTIYFHFHKKKKKWVTWTFLNNSKARRILLSASQALPTLQGASTDLGKSKITPVSLVLTQLKSANTAVRFTPLCLVVAPQFENLCYSAIPVQILPLSQVSRNGSSQNQQQLIVKDIVKSCLLTQGQDKKQLETRF